MIFAPSVDIVFVQPFLASGAAGTGLTVTAAVYKDGVAVGGHATDATTEIGSTGIYKYTLDSALTADPAVYSVAFNTAGTADQKHFVQSVQVAAMPATVDTIATSVGADLVGDVGDIATSVGDDLATPVAAIVTSVGEDLVGDVGDVATTLSAAKTEIDTMEVVVRDYVGVSPEKLTSYDPLGAHHSDALGSTYDSFTTPPRASGVWLQATVHDAYYTLNGSTPTTTNGFILKDSAVPVLIPTKAGDVIKVLRASSGTYLQRQYVRLKENFEA